MTGWWWYNHFVPMFSVAARLSTPFFVRLVHFQRLEELFIVTALCCSHISVLTAGWNQAVFPELIHPSAADGLFVCTSNEPVTYLHNQLVGTGHQCEAVGVVESLRNVLTECVAGSSRRDAPATAVIRVRPQQVTHGTLQETRRRKQIGLWAGWT